MKLKSLFSAIFIFALISQNQVFAQQLDKKMMSLYVINFIKYVQWPNQTVADYKIAVVGSSEVFGELSKISATKNINGKKIIVTQLAATQLDKLKEYNVVILSNKETNLLKKCSEVLANAPTLLITEKDGLTKKGASISMLIDEDDDFKTKFQINKQKIEEVGLKVSSELLALSSK